MEKMKGAEVKLHQLTSCLLLDCLDDTLQSVPNATIMDNMRYRIRVMNPSLGRTFMLERPFYFLVP